MSAIIEELNAEVFYNLRPNGKVVKVVEYERAVEALDIQKRALTNIFKGLLVKITLANALGRHENWDEILGIMIKDI